MNTSVGCPFCEIVAGTRPAHVVLATPTVVAFMDQYRQPADPGHVLVIPREHVENVFGVDDSLGADLFSAHARIARAVKGAFLSDGITTWSSNGPAAGQEVMHLHLHVFPRRRGVRLDDAVVRQEPEIPVADDILEDSAARIRTELTGAGAPSAGQDTRARSTSAAVVLYEARHCVRCGKGLSVVSIDGRERARCADCGWIWWDHARPVVLVLAVSLTGRVVLTRDARFPPARWGLVAGYIERGETAEEAALRELTEEAGLQGREPRVVGSDASGENVMVCVVCRIDDRDVAVAGHSEVERSMGTQVELAVPEIGRIMPNSPASRLIRRLTSGQLGLWEH